MYFEGVGGKQPSLLFPALCLSQGLLLVSLLHFFSEYEPFGNRQPFFDAFCYVTYFVNYFLLKISIISGPRTQASRAATRMLPQAHSNCSGLKLLKTEADEEVSRADHFSPMLIQIGRRLRCLSSNNITAGYSPMFCEATLMAPEEGPSQISTDSTKRSMFGFWSSACILYISLKPKCNLGE